VIVPPSYADRPDRTSSIEVFPEPLGPIRARISPGEALPETPLRMVLIVVVEPFFLTSEFVAGLGAAMLPRMSPLRKDAM
jgi:hypothetical protein